MKSDFENKPATTHMEEAETALNHFKYRIINVLPPGTAYLETFLKLADIQWSQRLPTAGITSEGTPRLLLNREFVNRYCRMDEDIMMLVLHELYHVLYGHHTLFKGAGLAHNIAFDAVINARLCRGWKSFRYAHFFRRIYENPGFPEILLCPPPEWPGTACPEIQAKEQERLAAQMEPDLVLETLDLRNRLYNNENIVSYEDILRLLQKQAPKAEPILLGGHHMADADEIPDTETGTDSDPLMVDTAQRLDEQLTRLESRKNAGSNMGLKSIHPAQRNPRKTFLQALRTVLVKAGVYQQRSSRHRRRALADTLRQSISILPEWRDRTVAAKEMLLDAAPLLYSRDTPSRAFRWEPAGQAHVYLDVSGSMCDDLPWIIGALTPLEKAGLCRIYLFSTRVFDIPKGDIGTKPLKTTWGTEIECILRHLMEIPVKKRPRQAVVLTDGYFKQPEVPLLEAFQETGIGLHGAITHTGSLAPMDSIAATAVKLPDYH